MIKFYLNNEEINVRTYPQIIETKDETLDTCNIVLEANDVSTPYAPYQKVRVERDGVVINNFVVASDSVSVFSNAPLKYTHTISLIQNIKSLEQHLLRNSVFAQPANNKRRFYLAKSETHYFDPSAREDYFIGFPADDTGSSSNKHVQIWVDDLVLNRKEKVKSAKIRMRKYEINEGGESQIKEIKTFYNPIIYLHDKSKASGYNYLDFKVNQEERQFNKWYDFSDFIDYINNSNGEITLGENNINLGSYWNEGDADVITFQMEVEVEVYYYNCFDILSDILKQYRKSYKGKINNEFLFELPTSGELYELLISTIPPSMTFTQSTIFEAVNEIFKLFDAIFTIDENNVLGIEYFNDIDKQEHNKNFVGKQQTISSNNYNNGLITYYQNAVKKEEFASSLKSTNVGIAQENSFSIIVPHNIDYIDKITCVVKSSGKIPCLEPLGSILILDEIELDLTPFIYEESIYNLLDDLVLQPMPQDFSYYNRGKQNSIYYTKGSNVIPIFSSTYQNWFGVEYLSIEKAIDAAWHRFFGFKNAWMDSGNNAIIAPNVGNDALKYFFKVNYYTKLDGRARIESIENKYKGELIVNQAQGQVDLDKLGLNMLGLSLKLGQPTLSFTHEISNFEDRIQKGQIYKDDNGDIWVANVCTYTILSNNLMQGNIEFTKNFNALSLNVKLDQEKRLSNISNDLTLKCEDDVIDYIYLTQENIYENEQINFDFASELVVATFKVVDSFEPVNVVAFSALNEKGEPLTFSNRNLQATNIYIPCVIYGFGNSICFETSFSSPISAGKQTSISPNWYAGKIYTIEYLYTDDNGWADKVNLLFMNLKSWFSQEFPCINEEVEIKDHIDYISIKELEYLKKPNEIFALNYQLIFLPTPKRENKDFIGQAFTKNSPIIEKTTNIKTYLYYETNDDFKYSVLDLKGHGNNIEEIVDVSIGGNKSINIKTNLIERPKAWSICDEEGNILFASNECLNFDNGVIILYLITRQNRL